MNLGFDKDVLDKGVVGFKEVMRGSVMCFEEGVEGFEDFRGVGFAFLEGVDDFNDINGQQFGNILSLGISEYLIADVEGSLDNIGVDHKHVAESLGQEQQSQRVLNI